MPSGTWHSSSAQWRIRELPCSVMECTILHENSCHIATTLVERRLNDRTLCTTVRVGLEFEHFGFEKHFLEEFEDALALLSRCEADPNSSTSAKLTTERPRALRCPGIPETTPFTSAKPTTDPSHPLRWTKQAQISRLHCRERKADPTPGYPTKRVGASVLLSHFRNRPTGFQAF